MWIIMLKKYHGKEMASGGYIACVVQSVSELEQEKVLDDVDDGCNKITFWGNEVI